MDDFREIDIKGIQEGYYDEDGNLVLGETREANMADLAELMDYLDKMGITLADLVDMSDPEE